MTEVVAAFGLGLAQGLGQIAAWGLAALLAVHVYRTFADPRPAASWWSRLFGKSNTKS